MWNTVADTIIKWRSYTTVDIVCDRFPLDAWHQIAGDISSDKEWSDFIINYSNSVKCWVLQESLTSDEIIAMIYVFNEDGKWQKVSIHGGGWKNPMLYYRGYVLMLKHLLDNNIKVRTSCQLLNTAAIRFSRSVGFVPYRYTEDEVYMWISTQRLTSSKLYKRFYNNDIRMDGRL